MLEQVLQNLHNWFDVYREFGEFTIASGNISLPFLKTGQYFRIIGSVFNDGVYQYPVDSLTDETFDGAVWALAIPQSVITLADEISDYAASNALTGYTSESFGEYSYQRATDGNGGVATWEDVFRSRLNQWRKI